MGYGDVRPEDTNRTRIGTMCIVLLGVITCLAGLVLLAEFFMDLHQQFMAKARGALIRQAAKAAVPPPKPKKLTKKQKSKLKASGKDWKEVAEPPAAEPNSDEEDDAAFVKSMAIKKPSGSGKGIIGMISGVFERYKVLKLIWMLAAFACCWGFLFKFVEKDWTWVDGVYYCVITGTTVGYGEFHHHMQQN